MTASITRWGFCAIIPATIPVSTSPVPPVAMPGIAGRVHPYFSIRLSNQSAMPLEHDNDFVLAGKRARNPDPIPLDFRNGKPGETCHLAGVRGDYKRAAFADSVCLPSRQKH